MRAYLQLEQARFGRRLQVRVEVDGALHGLAVPRLALLDAVRATVQEHIEPRPGGGTLVLTGAAEACTVGVAGDPPLAVVPLGAG